MQDLKKFLLKLPLEGIITDRQSDLVAYRDIGYDHSSIALIVRPQTYSEIAELLTYCSAHGIAVTPWGGGTNLCGACTPDRECVALDMKSFKDMSIDKENWHVTVQAGVVIENVEHYLNDHGFTFCHDPWSRRSSTVGGALSLDSVGNFYPKFGSIGDQVLSMRVMLADGRILELGRNITKSSASPFLPSIFIGSEGTLGIILEATLKIHPLPDTFDTMGYSFTSFTDMFHAIRELRNGGIEPQSYIGGTVPDRVEKLQPKSERLMVKLLNINAALFLYFDGIEEEVDARIMKATGILDSYGKKLPAKYPKEWWENRHTYFEMSPQLAEEGIYVHVFDLCLPLNNVLDMAVKIEDLSSKYNLEDRLSHTLFGAIDAYTVALYIDDTKKNHELLKDFERELVPIVHSFSGSVTRTHGLGTLFNEDCANEEIGADGLMVLKCLKNLLDPNHILNPGVMHRKL